MKSAGSESAGPAATRPFPKSSRLLKSAEFRRVYDQGVRFTNRFFSAFCLADSEPGRSSARIGFTVPRALGRAVKRNRMRRRLREAIRLELPHIGKQWDIVINPRRAVLDAVFDDIQLEVRKLVDRCKP
jgi:ribonuclease P protein component